MEVIPIQPRPILTRTTQLEVGDRVVTAIGRRWAAGDSGPGGRCRYCPDCIAENDCCLILVGIRVDRADAPTFSLVDLAKARGIVEVGPASAGIRHGRI